MIYGDGPTKPWRDVDSIEFERWLKAFPRPLEVDPPLSRKARFRRWSDPTLGGYPANVVAKQWRIRKNGGQQVRDDLRREVVCGHEAETNSSASGPER
jgi:hypothetical protein